MQGDYENEKDSLSEEMNTRTREHEIGARIQGFVLAIYREYQLHGVINYGVLRDYSVLTSFHPISAPTLSNFIQLSSLNLACPPNSN